jgi:hypothetical protein
MRYQQAYSASLFSNVAGECIYVTSFRYEYYPQTNNVPDTSDWTMRLQINLSTTQRSVDDLSVNFSENVGLDDTVVFGPTRIDFKSGFGKLLFFDQPFRYGLFQGNLLLDVRVWDASGTIGFGHIDLEAQDSSTDEVSRVWATNVAATVASGVDTTGLLSAFQFTPVPALQIEVRSVFGTNRPVLSWPAQPSVFVPQTSAQLGNNAVWQTITNGILGSPEGPDRAIYLTTPSAGTSGFFRLLWQSGQPVQLSIVPDIPANPREGSQTK